MLISQSVSNYGGYQFDLTRKGCGSLSSRKICTEGAFALCTDCSVTADRQFFQEQVFFFFFGLKLMKS